MESNVSKVYGQKAERDGIKVTEIDSPFDLNNYAHGTFQEESKHTTFNTAINLWHYHSFAQIASIFGVNALTFLHCWFTALFCLFMYTNFVDADRLTIPKPFYARHLMVCLAIMGLVLLYGGFRLNVKHFWVCTMSTRSGKDIRTESPFDELIL